MVGGPAQRALTSIAAPQQQMSRRREGKTLPTGPGLGSPAHDYILSCSIAIEHIFLWSLLSEATPSDG